MKETALLFGPGKSLVGVITDPASERALGETPFARTAVVLLNAGLLHRVGPNRLYVKLARRLAASGLVVLRFDLSGIGDSRSTSERTGFEDRAVVETRAAMDLLASLRGSNRFVVGGLCSGADNAVRVASVDPRIAGLALLEPFSGAPSAGQILGSYRDRLLRPGSWFRLLTGQSELWSELMGRLKARRARRREGQTEGAAATGNKPEPVPSSAPASPGQEMRAFAERGGALCLVYSADNPAHYHYAGVLRGDLQGLPETRVRVEVVPETDHVFTPLEAQSRVLEVLADWVEGLARV